MLKIQELATLNYSAGQSLEFLIKAESKWH
jgi:hypothetical protein